MDWTFNPFQELLLTVKKKNCKLAKIKNLQPKSVKKSFLIMTYHLQVSFIVWDNVANLINVSQFELVLPL